MKGEIAITDASDIKKFKVDNRHKGSLFYSPTEENVLLTIKNSFLTCQPLYLANDATASINSQQSNYSGAIYMDRSLKGIVSYQNVFQNCYNCSEGGVYFLQNTKLNDQLSAYSNIQSLFGGVMKCLNCEFNITYGTMDYNRAVYGGVFLVENAGQGIIYATSFVNTTALMQGGVMSIQQSGVMKKQYTSITFSNCKYITDSYAAQGGVLFVS